MTAHWLDDTYQQSARLAARVAVRDSDFRRLSDHRQDVDSYPQFWQHTVRIEYLREHIADLVEQYWQQSDRLDDYILRVRQIEMVLMQEVMTKTVEGIRQTLREIRERQDILNDKVDEKMKDRITPEMIERARAYPFEQLIEFNRAGFAPCPWHEEKSPSLHYNRKNNTVHCFGCHKTVDTIDWMIEREGVRFPDAVRRLQG